MSGPYYYLTQALGGPGALRYPVTIVPQMIGRSEQADITLLEPTISREHATIELKGTADQTPKVVIRDLGSRHGTFVNSRRITSTDLRTGDIVLLGAALVLRLEQSDAPVPFCDPYDVTTIGPGPIDEIKTPVASPPLDASGSEPSRPFADEQLEALRDQLASMHKLAAVGAYCSYTLPDLAEQLGRVISSLRQRGDLDRQTLLAALDPIHECTARLSQRLIPHPAREKTALGAVLQRALASVKPYTVDRDLRIETHSDMEYEIRASPSQLQAALIEVLRFAINNSPAQATLRVIASRHESGVNLSVADQGPRLSTELLERVFDPLYTLRADRIRFGMGLFEARHLVAVNGGTLRVVSRDTGTTTYLTLAEA